MKRYYLALVLAIGTAFFPLVKADTLFLFSAKNDLVWNVLVIGYVQPYQFSNDTYFEIGVNVTNTGTQAIWVYTWNFYAETQSDRQLTVDALQTTFSGMNLQPGLYTHGKVAFSADQTDPVAVVGYRDDLNLIDEMWTVPEYSLEVLIIFPIVVSIPIFLMKKRSSQS